MKIKNRYSNELILQTEFTDLEFTDLRYADLKNADLRYADLEFTDLRYADLKNADLKYVDLRNAKDQYGTIKNIITGPVRDIDSYIFLLRLYENHEPVIFAGCRQFTFQEYYNHIETYSNKDKKRETLHILSFFEFYLHN